MLKVVIFGAQSLALGTCKAVQELFADLEVVGFLVSHKAGNPSTLAGFPVHELKSFGDKKVCVLVATPEDMQQDIVNSLETNGFHNHICVDSAMEVALMERYYRRVGNFLPLSML